MRLLALTLTAGLALAIPGCKKSNEDLLKSTIAEMNRCADLMENDASADEIIASIEQINAYGKEIKDRKVSKSEDKRLKEEYEEPFKKAMKRFTSGMMKFALKNPEKAKKVSEAAKKLEGSGPSL